MRSRKPGASQGPTEQRDDSNIGRWTDQEHKAFEEGLRRHGKAWKLIAEEIPTRTVVQIRTHAQKYFLKLAKQDANTSTSIALRPSSSSDDVNISLAPKQRRSARKRRAVYDDEEWEEESPAILTSGDEDSSFDGDMTVEPIGFFLKQEQPSQPAPHGAGSRRPSVSSQQGDLPSAGPHPPSLMIKIPTVGSEGELPSLLPPGNPFTSGRALPTVPQPTTAPSASSTTAPLSCYPGAFTCAQHSPTSVADIFPSAQQAFFPEAGAFASRPTSYPGGLDPTPHLMPLPPLISGRGASEWCDPLTLLEDQPAACNLLYAQEQQQQPAAAPAGRSSFLSQDGEAVGAPDVCFYDGMAGSGVSVGGREGRPSPAKRRKGEPEVESSDFSYATAGSLSSSGSTDGEEEEGYGFFVSTDEPEAAAAPPDDDVLEEVMRLLWDEGADEFMPEALSMAA